MKREELLMKVMKFINAHRPTSKSGYIKASVLLLLGLRAIQQVLRINGLWMKKSVSGKHIVITGAGSGIGRQMALMLAKKGAKVSIWDINFTAA
jgi:5,10-methylene-tetrahydrofolate dehydrogenase/methenyl tetrahydrofolate cyclohydrolase